MSDDDTSRPGPVDGGTPASVPPRLLVTTMDAAGIERSRLIPRDRVASALESGVQASISSVAMFTPRDEPVDAAGIDAVVGDLVVRPDSAGIRVLDDDRGLSWAPGDLLWPDGSAFFACGRDAVRRATDGLRALGLAARVGFELEFTVTVEGPDGRPRPAHMGPAYGQRPLLANEHFLQALLDALEGAGAPVLALHAEHGLGQFELSLGATDPLSACDDYLLARLIVERVCLDFGLAVHFVPIPPVGSASNGMHIHLSVLRDDANLLSPSAGGQPGSDGGAVIAGVLDVLPAATALLAGSEPSYERLRPGRWSGAALCWGIGNREAAVRYVPATAAAGPSGANIEIKPGDASANHYLAVAAILTGAADGVAGAATPPAPVALSPTRLSDDERESLGIRSLPSTLVDALEQLDRSALLRRQLGDRLVDLYLAVRRPRD